MMIRAPVILVAAVMWSIGSALGEPKSTDEIVRRIEAAEPGQLVVVPEGVYVGTLRVTRPCVLEGEGLVTIDARGGGTVVEILCPGVTFRGFTVRASASGVDREPAGIRAEAGPVVIEGNRLEDVLFGIDLRTSSGSIVRSNSIVGKDMESGRRGDGIRLWWSHDCVVEDNVVRQARDMVFWYSENLRIRRNTVSDSRYGLHFMYSHDTVLEHNELLGNSVGIYLMYSNGITLDDNRLAGNRGPSGYGIGLKDCDDVVVRANVITANRVGVYVDNTPSSVDAHGLIEANFIAVNEIGMLVTPNTKNAEIVNNGFVDNEEQVAVHGRGDLAGNAFARDRLGNFWSDYAGFDRDDDGVGDLPYRADSLFESLLAREPNLRLFIHSPAQQAVEFTARALPQTRPEPKFVDPAPLTHVPAREAGASGSFSPGMAACAGALMAIGVGLVLGFGRAFPVDESGGHGP